ncbi:hypothetical protein HZ989_11775 [Brevundimonas sp. AJA228-03]|uniref:hypothetical protein n=1 Tax=Brevundimonas sp. AJA228-03 TaxID=2752515 RepID=UPI001ADFFEEC|nr:hypothetical protein [Brevundimonas sp. AJA228-03]QTN18908.1 hypothetical protein HZ989_11775 [Brevundimonas sp. AJA228-03]
MDIDLAAFWRWLVEGQDGSRFANTASAIGFVVGVIGLFLALLTYRKNSTDAAFAHVHALFREYLTESPNATTATDPKLSFHFYVLEEMVIWLSRQRWPLSSLSKDDRDAWTHTIRCHIYKHPAAIKRLVHSHPSYGKPFLRFVFSALSEHKATDELTDAESSEVKKALANALKARLSIKDRLLGREL